MPCSEQQTKVSRRDLGVKVERKPTRRFGRENRSSRSRSRDAKRKASDELKDFSRV